MINRGMRPAEQVLFDDWFNPNLDLLGQTMALQQKQIDDAATSLAKIGETQFKHLKQDREHAEKAYQDIYANVDRLAKGAMGDGDLRSVKREIDQYTRDVSRRFRPEGDIGAMVSNYEAFNKWNEELSKLVGKEIGKGGITAEHADALRSSVLQGYASKGGIGAGDPNYGFNQIGLRDAALAVDENELVETYGKGYVSDSFDGVQKGKDGAPLQGAMWRDNGIIWRKTSYGKEIVDEQDVFRDLLSAITNHEGYTQYQDQLYAVGVSPYNSKNIYTTNEKGETVLDKQHPLVAAAMRGASKFGFVKIKYDDDIKFDPYDLELFKSNLRMKEEKAKGQSLVFESTAVDTSIDPKELTERSASLKETTDSRKNLIEATKAKLEAKKAQAQGAVAAKQALGVAGGKPMTVEEILQQDNEYAMLQADLNKLVQQQQQEIMQMNAATNAQQSLLKEGGYDTNKEASTLDYTWENYGKKHFPTKEAWKVEFDKIVRGEKKLRAEDFPEVQEAMRRAGKDTKRETLPVPNVIKQLSELTAERERAINAGAKKGLTRNDSVVLTTENTSLGGKMKLIKDALASGQLNFVDEFGNMSFNMESFNKEVAAGNVDVVPVAGMINGKPGFKVTIKGKDGGKEKGFKTYTGNILGLENQTWANELAVDLREQAASEKVTSKAKADQLYEVADMIDGSNATATSLTGAPTGHGKVGTQIELQNVSILPRGGTSESIYLPAGLSMKLLADGRGGYKPLMFDERGVAIDGRDLGLTSEFMSVSNIQAWIGRELQSAENPYYKTKGTTQSSTTTKITR